jgi:hypothetical protein
LKDDSPNRLSPLRASPASEWGPANKADGPLMVDQGNPDPPPAPDATAGIIAPAMGFHIRGGIFSKKPVLLWYNMYSFFDGNSWPLPKVNQEGVNDEQKARW